ncbi:MAG: hypothetical protein U0X91_22415 [Spirosomataceae bacterium]
MNKPLFFGLLFTVVGSYAQRDTAFTTKAPVTYSFSLLLPIRSIGVQAGIASLLKQNEIYKHASSKKPKIIRKERWLSIDLGFYSQKELHNSLFLTGSYRLRRVNPYGYYRQFSPFLGISQTFLNEESYSVTADNEVVLHKIAGNFYLTGGFGLSFGKVFTKSKAPFIRDIHAGLLMQSYYPNFRFLALHPAFQLGLEAGFPAFSRNFKKKIITRP